MLDACRTCSLRTRMMVNEGLIRVTHGLAAMKPAHGEIVFFAARHDTMSWGWKDENRPSFFTDALLKHMEEEGLELGQFFRKVTNNVLEAITNAHAGALCLRPHPGRGLLFQTAAAIPLILLATARSSTSRKAPIEPTHGEVMFYAARTAA